MISLVVVLPVHRGDFHLALKWIAWARWLASQPDAVPYDIAVFGAASLEEPLRVVLRQAIAGWATAKLEINPQNCERPELGYGYMANSMFRAALEMTERFYPGRPTLWCEPDAIPTRPTWVEEIDEEYARCGQPFLGDFHALGAIPHLCGNSVYSAQWRTFAPSIANLPNPNPPQGWDTQCSHETRPQSARSTLIQQAWIVPAPHFTESNMAIVHRGTALFHRCKDGSLIDVLSARLKGPRIPLSAPLVKPTPTKPHRLIGQRDIITATMPVAPKPPPGLKMHMLIVSCRRDADMLSFLLKSIEKYARGFSGITVMLPQEDVSFVRIVPTGVRILPFKERPGKGFIHHMVNICRADEFCPEADMILHVDSDNLFWQQVTPNDYAPGGKCLLVREPYSKIENRNRARLAWRECVQRATGFTPQYDTMVRHPNVYPKELYWHVRNLVEMHTKQAFDDYVFSCTNGFPQTFCEFVTLGNIGLRDFPEKFHVVDYDHEAECVELGIPGRRHQYVYRPGRDKMVEGWSHGGMSKYRNDWNRFLRGTLPKFYLK